MIFALPSADGYDDESIEDVLLVEDLDENQLLECWEDLDEFPYDNGSGVADPETEEGRKQFIFYLLRRLSKNPDLHFGANIPAC